MELAVVFLTLFALVFLLSNPRNTYHLLFSAMLVGVALAMAVTLLMATKGSNYSFSLYNFPFSRLRFNIYQMLSSLFVQKPLSTLVRLRNLGISIYLLCINLFIHSFYNSLFIRRRRRQFPTLFVLTLCVAILYVLYDPQFAFGTYIRYHRFLYQNPVEGRRMYLFITGFYNLLPFFLTAYLAYPSVYLVVKGLKRQMSFFTEQLTGLALSLGLLNVTILFLFFFSNLHLSAEKMLLSGIWIISQVDKLPSFFSTFLPMIVLLVLCASFYFTMWFGIDNVMGKMREKTIRKNLSQMYLNLRNVFHADKNLFFSLQKLSEIAIENYGSPEGMDALKNIQKVTASQTKTLTDTLNYIKKMNVTCTFSDLIDIIESALREVEALPNIEIIRHYSSEEVPCYLDAYHLTKMFTNVFHNAVDAIINTRPSGTITVLVTSSRDWIFVSITDNGCGMPRKRMGRFTFTQPIQPTKPNHFGIGLPYIHQVVHAHGGHLKYRSKPDVFTSVEILLPQARQDRTKER